MDFLGEAGKLFDKATKGISRGADILKLEQEAAELSKLAAENWAVAGRRAQILLRAGHVRDSELAAAVRQAETQEERLQAVQKGLVAAKQGQRVRRCRVCEGVQSRLAETCEHCDAKLPACEKCLEPLSADDAKCPACEAPANSQPGAAT